MDGSGIAPRDALQACRAALFSGSAARAFDAGLAGVDAAPAREPAAPRRQPYNSLTALQFARTDFAALARTLREDGLVVFQSKIPLDNPEEWDRQEKSVAVRLHSFEPATYLAQHWYLSGDRDALAFMLRCTARWIASKANDIAGLDSWLELRSVAHTRPVEDFAWYDTSIPARTAMFAYLAAEQAHEARALRPRLLAATLADLAVLFDRDLFRAHNNHGLFQAFSLLATVRSLAAILDVGELIAPFETLAEAMIAGQFFPSGMHREHSAGYHLSILSSIHNAIASGLLERPRLTRLLAEIEAGMVFFIKPDFSIATVGDTDPQALSFTDAELATVGDPALRYLLSQGRLGEPPAPGLKHAIDAGYVLHRGVVGAGPEAAPSTSYFLQQGGFHGFTHKHCDDLSFIWHDRGREILTDAGRYGYRGTTPRRSELRRLGFFYSDPKRIFCELPRAHNTIEFDALPYDRRELPPGNEIVFAREAEGIAATEGVRRHAAGVTHRRIVLICPGRWLAVIDGLIDEAGARRRYRQFFQLAEPWAPDYPDGTEWRAGEERLFVTRFSRHRLRAFTVSGKTSPWLGWVSSGAWALRPSRTLWSRVGPIGSTVLATAFALGAPISLDLGPTLHSDDLSRLDVTIAAGRERVRVRRMTEGGFGIERRCG